MFTLTTQSETQPPRAHSSPPGTLPKDVGGPSGLLDQSNLIYGQQVVSRASNGVPSYPAVVLGTGSCLQKKHDLGKLFPRAAYGTYRCHARG